jgi:hypothetical protein
MKTNQTPVNDNNKGDTLQEKVQLIELHSNRIDSWPRQ